MKNNIKKLLFFLMLTILSFYLIITIFNIQLSISSEKTATADVSDIWTISDKYGQKGEKTIEKFFKEEESLLRLKKMNQSLHSNFYYSEFIIQPIEYSGYYSGDEIFINGNNLSLANQLLNINGESRCFTPLKAMQISKETWEYHDIACIDGEEFVDSDYIGSSNIIPVVLGYHYIDIYHKGDIITCNYLLEDRELLIKGFLEPGTQIFDTICDDFIVMPALSILDINESWAETSQKILYSQKNSGKIINTQKSNAFSENQKVINIGKELDLKYSILGYSQIKSNWIYLKLLVLLFVMCGVIITDRKYFMSYKQFLFFNISTLLPSSVIFSFLYNIPNKFFIYSSILYTGVFLLIFCLLFLRRDKKDNS